MPLYRPRPFASLSVGLAFLPTRDPSLFLSPSLCPHSLAAFTCAVLPPALTPAAPPASPRMCVLLPILNPSGSAAAGEICGPSYEAEVANVFPGQIIVKVAPSLLISLSHLLAL